MTDVFRTMIVPANLVTLARSLAAGLSSGGAGMFVTELAPSSAGPVTHYVSTGHIKDTIAALLTDANALHAACQAAGAQVTLAQCQALVTQSDVSEEDPFTAFARLGLTFVSTN